MAAPGYTVSNLMAGTQQNISTAITSTTGTILRLVTPAASTKRFYVWELDFGQSGPPNVTDCSVQWVLEQIDATGGAASANGSSTAITAQPTTGYVTASNLDLAVTIPRGNYVTTAPTNYLQAATFYAKGINQRGAGFWQAAPGGELYFPLLASTGPGMAAYSATYNATVIARINFTEI
jgi:hypothetical protein